MSLARFAWRIAGPIDAAINFAINGGLALFFLYRADVVPVFGWLSAYNFLAPMVFCVLTFATWFGIRNGMIQRGKFDTPWSARAWRVGLTYGVSGWAAFTLICFGIDRDWPELRIPAHGLILFDVLGSAALGYAVQVHGVLRAESLIGTRSVSEDEPR
jgi:hypothetical protein